MKVLQISDMHLGASLTGFPSTYKTRIRTNATEIINKIPMFMREHEIDGLIIPGDLFDNEKNAHRWIFLINKMFEQILSDSKFVVYASGNHDYWIGRNHFRGLGDYDKFVLFDSANPESSLFTHKGVQICAHGVGYEVRQPYEPIIGKMGLAVENCINLGVVHGVVSGKLPEGKAPYYPMSIRQIESLNYDYTALGHIHESMQVSDACAYSGCLTPSRLQDTGLKGGLVIDIGPGGVGIEQVPLGAVALYEIIVPVKASSFEEYMLRVYAIEEQQLLSDVMYHVIFEGDIGFIWESAYEALIMQSLEQYFGYPVLCKFNHRQRKNLQAFELPTEFTELCEKSYERVIEEIAHDRLNVNFLSSKESMIEKLTDSKESLLASLYELWKKGDGDET
ncbi:MULTISPECIES: metallophosphoesterase [unclassified Fusibacter]|uniref:metallophosphoesterase family protein n=1 Tax=unclassified Fusibacter TaxID=2624464 RepID=UPI001011DAD0|nr:MULTISPECIES: metallophosphoesterase [unclassified Fusibacter]MCK8058264.1 metallophosphoesterase [Fusibacter sp. A2]NPE20847.1 hypothetical protein [Fusibacter sp. A1]RXV63051.1 hypothetical protein DWB64_03365 [Fusibacter sp. A1]